MIRNNNVTTDPIYSTQIQRKRRIYINWKQFTKSQHGTLPQTWSFSYPKLTLLHSETKIAYTFGLFECNRFKFTSTTCKQKYQLGQPEHVTVNNHNKSTTLEWSAINSCWGRGGDLNKFYWIQPLALSFHKQHRIWSAYTSAQYMFDN